MSSKISFFYSNRWVPMSMTLPDEGRVIDGRFRTNNLRHDRVVLKQRRKVEGKSAFRGQQEKCGKFAN